MPPKKSSTRDSGTLKPRSSRINKSKSKSSISTSPATISVAKKPPPAMSTRSKAKPTARSTSESRSSSLSKKSATRTPRSRAPSSSKSRPSSSSSLRQRGKQHIANIINVPDTGPSALKGTTNGSSGNGFMGFGFVRNLFSRWGYSFGTSPAKKTTGRPASRTKRTTK
ncbi:hypothetical protein TWF694_003378 [Orbilia ellipsospora]|uniref:Uncharacterized protein n=1 Tax=Orbilia ellipsospora TaxID=2528407 RepID=A0AAV9WZC4_9PEZI